VWANKKIKFFRRRGPVEAGSFRGNPETGLYIPRQHWRGPDAESLLSSALAVIFKA
jgi:hypothetical protein